MGLCAKAHRKACTAWLSMTSNFVVILSLFLLDVRDLYYKIAWIGPSESFSFRTGSISVLHPQPLQIASGRDLRQLNTSTPIAMDSGWPSFLARCEALHAMGADGSLFFLSALGINCTLADASVPVGRLVMTSDQRVDAVVWASCSLLHVSRRPRICYEHIVTGFYRRYVFKESSVLGQVIPAAANSPAEAELYRMLEMVSDSIPMHHIVCVEAFALTDADLPASTSHTPTVFGCSSPNSFRSEFVGMQNPQITRLLHGMAWITADAISVMSTRYLIRQNCFTQYDITTEDTQLVLQSHTRTNFSSFGQLYALLIIIDVTLLTLNCLSSLELIKWMSFPKYSELKQWAQHREAAETLTRSSPGRDEIPKQATRSAILLHFKRRFAALKVRIQHADHQHSTVTSPDAESVSSQERSPPRLTRIERRRRLLATMEAMGGVAAIEEEQLYSFFSRSLYRNPRIVVITLTSQFISWLLVLPNAVVWTWSKSIHQQVQAYLSSIRCWVLLLILCNLLWSGLVRVSEPVAYAITKRTFLTSIDIICIVSLVSFLQRHSIFAMAEKKYNLEHQRVNDVTSFRGGYLAHGNTFHNALDSIDMTSSQIFGILYGPLVRILFSSIGVAIVVLSIKAIFFSRQRRVMQQRAQHYMTKQIARMSHRLSKKSTASVLNEIGSNSAIRTHPNARTDCSAPSDIADEELEFEKQEKVLLEALSEPYHRLPLEEWLDQPIRATSLIRNGLRMETVKEGTRFIRPSCYLDFGIIVKRGVIHSRIGFADSWKPRMTVTEYMTRVEHQNPAIDALSLPAQNISPLDRSTDFILRVGSNARLNSRQDMHRKRSLHVPLA